MTSDVRKTLRVILTCVIAGLGLAGCSFNDAEPVTEEDFLEQILSMQEAVNEPVLDPYYAGITFNGNEPSAAALTVEIYDADRRGDMRTIIRSEFGRVSRAVSIDVIPSGSSVASEELKTELQELDGWTSLNYNPQVDRVEIGVNDLQNVNRIEATLEERGVPETTYTIRAQRLAVAF
jgi:hypothetical protein